MTVEELPAYTSKAKYIDTPLVIGSADGGKNSVLQFPMTAFTTHSEAGNVRVSNGGGDKAHNNMQPYTVVYIWNRTK